LNDSANATPPPTARRAWIAALLLFVVGSALRIHDVAALSVNGDEIYTIWETRTARAAADSVGFATAWKQRFDLMVKADPPPPPGVPKEELWRLRWGYRTNPLHLVANEVGFALLGDTPLAARLSSLLFGIAALVVLPLLARGLWGDRYALLLLAVIALSPNAIEHSRFARYYAASFLFGGVAALAAARFTQHRRRSDELLFVVASLLLVASHMTGALVAALLLLWMAFGARSRIALACVALTAAAGWAAWHFGPLRKVADTIRDGIVPTNVYRSWHMAAGLVYNVGPGLMALGALAIGWWPPRGRRAALVPLALTVLAPAWVLFTLNYRHDIGPRYFTAIEGVGALVAACGLERLVAATERRRLARGVAALLLVAQLPLLASNQVDGQRFPIAEATARIAALRQPGDRVVANWSGIYEYYLDRNYDVPHEVMELPTNLATLEERMLEGDKRRALLVLERQRGRVSWSGPAARLEEWLGRHAQPIATFGEERFDSLLERFGAGYRYELALFEVDLTALRAERGG
jgi:hypothetical protein